VKQQALDEVTPVYLYGHPPPNSSISEPNLPQNVVRWVVFQIYFVIAEGIAPGCSSVELSKRTVSSQMIIGPNDPPMVACDRFAAISDTGLALAHTCAAVLCVAEPHLPLSQLTPANQQAETSGPRFALCGSQRCSDRLRPGSDSRRERSDLVIHCVASAVLTGSRGK